LYSPNKIDYSCSIIADGRASGKKLAQRIPDLLHGAGAGIQGRISLAEAAAGKFPLPALSKKYFMKFLNERSLSRDLLFCNRHILLIE